MTFRETAGSFHSPSPGLSSIAYLTSYVEAPFYLIRIKGVVAPGDKGAEVPPLDGRLRIRAVRCVKFLILLFTQSNSNSRCVALKLRTLSCE